MPRVREEGTIFHIQNMFHPNDTTASCSSNKKIAKGSCISHGHNEVTIHSCFQCFPWVNLGNNNFSTHSISPFSDTLTNEAITSYNNNFSSNIHICQLS